MLKPEKFWNREKAYFIVIERPFIFFSADNGPFDIASRNVAVPKASSPA